MDLFAGSGGVGIEALSRGAVSLDCVEQDAKALTCIRTNLKTVGFDQKAKVWPMSVERALQQFSTQGRKFDMIFMDPPYNQDYEKHVFEILQNASYVTEDTLIVVETSLETTLDYIENLGFYIEKEKKYKTNKHFFVKRKTN